MPGHWYQEQNQWSSLTVHKRGRKQVGSRGPNKFDLTMWSLKIERLRFRTNDVEGWVMWTYTTSILVADRTIADQEVAAFKGLIYAAIAGND